MGSLEALNARLDDLERELAPLDAGTKYLRSTPTMWPLVGRIGSHFGGRLDPFTRDADVHFGIDIVAAKGTPVKATADGIVRISAAPIRIRQPDRAGASEWVLHTLWSPLRLQGQAGRDGS